MPVPATTAVLNCQVGSSSEWAHPGGAQGLLCWLCWHCSCPTGSHTRVRKPFVLCSQQPTTGEEGGGCMLATFFKMVWQLLSLINCLYFRPVGWYCCRVSAFLHTCRPALIALNALCGRGLAHHHPLWRIYLVNFDEQIWVALFSAS